MLSAARCLSIFFTILTCTEFHHASELKPAADPGTQDIQAYSTLVTILNLMESSITVNITTMSPAYSFQLDPTKVSDKILVPLIYRNPDYLINITVNSTEFVLDFNPLNVVSPSILLVFYPVMSLLPDVPPTIAYVIQRTFSTPPSLSTTGPYDNNYLLSVTVLPPSPYPQSYFISSSNCVGCDFQPFQATTNGYIFDNSAGRKTIKVLRGPADALEVYEFKISEQFRSRGVYSLFHVVGQGSGDNKYSLVTVSPPESSIRPILIAAGYVVVVVLAYLAYKRYWDKIEADEYYSVRKNIQNTSETPDYMVEERIVETDIMRGLAIVLFILVNSGGGGYIFLNESPWEGLQLGDLPELSIAWVTGFSTPFLIKYKARMYKSRRSFVKFILIKSIILIGFGFSYNGNFDLSKFIFTGFFQRLGLGFMINALMAFWLPLVKNDLEHGEKQLKRILLRGFLLLLLPITHIILTLTLHESACPRGYVGPGGISSSSLYSTCTGGAARLIDLKVFGTNHIPEKPNCQLVYKCIAFDKYGMLGTLNFIFGMFLATLIGEGFIKYKERRRRFIYLLCHALFLVMLLGASFLFTDFNSWGAINRNLYSPMFMVAGTLFMNLFFVLLMYIRSVVKYKGWPFVQIGLNGIAILFMQEICKDILPFGYTNDGRKQDLVICAIMNISIWTAFALTLHGYKFYIKI